MKRRRLIALIVIGILLLAGILWWVLGDRTTSPRIDRSVITNEAIVRRGDLTAFVSATGRTDVIRRARIASPLSGLVTEVHVEMGNRVTDEQPLLAFDTTELESRLQEARAGLEVARGQQARAEAGAAPAEIEAAQAQVRAAALALTVAEQDLEALPEDEQAESEEAVTVEQARASLEQARASLRRLVEGPSAGERQVLAAQVEQAEARVEQAEEALDQATVRAPFNGTIVERAISAGERASFMQHLLTVADMDTIVIVAEVDEVDVGYVSPGQSVDVTLDAFPTQPLEGTVQRVAPASGVQRGATTYRTIVPVDVGNLPVRLDMAADLQIQIAEAEDTLLLPQNAIRYAETQPYVIVRREGEAVRQDVVLGARDTQMVEVLRGVEEGEVVLLP